MIQFDGRFRGIVVDHVVGETQKGYPQWTATLQANEMWDADNGWQPFDDGVNNQVTLFAVLANEAGEIFWAESVRNVMGWSTNSFADLQNMDLAGHPIQFVVQYEEYNGKNNPKIQAIAAYDSETCGGGGSLKAADANQLSNLDSKFSKFMKAPAGGMKKPAKPKGAPKPTQTNKPATQVTPTQSPTKTERPDITFESLDAVWDAVLAQPGVDDSAATEAWQKVVPEVMASSQIDEAGFQQTEFQQVFKGVLDIVLPF
jgi:hypothetical protein